MDIKQTKPSLLQEASAALNQTAISSDSPSFMAQFNIRTMANDLKKDSPANEKPIVATAPTAPTPVIKETPIAIVPPPAPAPPKPAPAPQKETLKSAPINLPTLDEPSSISKPEVPLTPPPKPIPPVTPLLKAESKTETKTEPKPPLITQPNLSAIQTEAIETKEEIDIKKVAIVGFSSIIVLALVVGGLWFFLGQPSNPLVQISPTLSSSPEPSISTPTPPVVPPALFPADSQKIFTLRTGQEKTDWQEALAQLARSDEPAGNFVYFLFQDSQNNFPSLEQLASSTDTDLFNLPTQSPAGPLKDQLNLNSFSFFAYSQTQASSSPFENSPAAGRLGLIIAVKINASSTEELSKSLKDLEQLMLPSLKVLLSDAQKVWPAKPVFLNNLYRQVAIRYINLPEPDFSLDYAILNDQLIFATSKASMYAIIDRLLLSTK